ncbi:uncharacterized protein LOC130907652 [Corythoichthys intestinalis]|uniref:uncharacterized protein LOC130907652 n=1 Tax=Corythoichthys intestinalis TaxID=161448 RepID=UPI0025A5773A|nr:uncharacterized protein LOC130907652 [Corythoichthys intestinalis]
MLKHSATGLLLVIPLLIADVSGDRIRLMFQCANSVCYNIWTFEPKRDIVIFTQEQSKNADYRQCTTYVRTEDNRGLQYCKMQTEDAFTRQDGVPERKVAPGNTVSFRCVLLSSLMRNSCSRRSLEVRLTWLDLFDQQVRDNSSHLVQQTSACDATLSVTLEAPGIKAFKCQASDGTLVQNSAVMRVQVPAVKGKGRGGFDSGVEPQDDNRYPGSVVAAVLVCTVLTALATIFVVMKRRKAANQVKASRPIATNDEVADDVVYADVVHSVGPERVSFCHGEDTEYASIRYD